MWRGTKAQLTTRWNAKMKGTVRVDRNVALDGTSEEKWKLELNGAAKVSGETGDY